MLRLLPLRAPTASHGSLKTLTFLLFLPLVLLCCASTTNAVPIVITGGTASTPIGINNFSLNVTGMNFNFHGADTSAPDPQLCGLCRPGQQFGGTFLVPLDTPLALTYNGRAYYQQAVIISSGNFITLPLLTIPTDFSPLISPFSFIGKINVTPVDGSAPLTFDMTGAGTVTFIFLPTNNGTTSLVQATYTFAPPEPVPEPATILLLSTGLAGAVAAKRRRRRKE